MPRRFAVILAADVVDYSLMMSEDEDATISLIRELRETSLEPVAVRNDGEVLKRMGDGWIIAFPSVGDAVATATDVQRSLEHHPKVRLRIGIHMGDLVEDEADIYGASVNVASRLQTEAPPGGVMISAELHSLLAEKQAQGFVGAGTFKLKNIMRPVQGYQWRPAAGTERRRTNELPVIAVESFSSVPRDEETALAAAELRDQIIHGLSRRTGLRVCDAAADDVEESTYALRGRLRVSGQRMRANLSLLLRADGSTSWSELYEGEDADIFAFCDQVAAKADGDLRLYINSLDNVRIAEISDENLSVSELRTRGAGLFYECTIPALDRCRSAMERARRLSPDDGMALSMWASAVSMMNYINFETPDQGTVDELTAAYDRAVELLPRSDFVFYARSLFRAATLRDADRAMADARRCFALNRNYPQARMALGYAHMLAGNFSRAAEELAAGTQLTSDPFWAYRVFHKSVAQFCGEDYPGALATLRDLTDLKRSVRGFRKLLALALRASGDAAAAEAEEANADTLPDGPNFHVQKPPLPESHAWLIEALAPGSQ